MDRVLKEVEERGFSVLEGVLDDVAVARYREALYAARDRIGEHIGEERLARALTHGDPEIRLPMCYDLRLLDTLEEPTFLAVVDGLLSPKAILRFYNGFIHTPSVQETPFLHQYGWHMNFPVVHNGYRVAVDVVLFLADSTPHNGPLLVAPGTHQQMERPTAEDLEAVGEPIFAAAGSMLIMDSTTWHREEQNLAGADQVYLTHQLVRPYVKPHFDHIRALGEKTVRSLPERTQRLLGWTTRVPASLEDFYVESEERLYRAGEW